MTSDWLIEKVGDRYWLSWCGWRKGSFPSNYAAVCERQRTEGYTMLEHIQREREKQL